MASVLKGLKLQRGTRRQNSSSGVRGIDSKKTVNKLTANTGQEQLYLLASKMILMQSTSHYYGTKFSHSASCVLVVLNVQHK